MPDAKTEEDHVIDAHFFHLVATFEAAAMQQLGKIANPVTGEVDVSLDGARASIDIIAMLERKTAGNLSQEEQKLLAHVLHQLRMNYVDVAKSEGVSEGRQGESPEAGGDEDSDSTGAAEAEPGGAAGDEDSDSTSTEEKSK